jgi:hypothetical protein
MRGFQGNNERAFNMFDQASQQGGDGSTVVFGFAGGVFPQGVGAITNIYVRGLAPSLANFVNSLNACPTSQNTTVIGHSYGGPIINTALTHGMRANNLVHVASAGKGHERPSASDFPDTRIWALTSPNDPINLVEPAETVFRVISRSGALSSVIGHGENPIHADGVTRLSTGAEEDGEGIFVGSSHSAVLDRGTESFDNIVGVIIDGPVRLHHQPPYMAPGPGPGPAGTFKDIRIAPA